MKESFINISEHNKYKITNLTETKPLFQFDDVPKRFNYTDSEVTSVSFIQLHQPAILVNMKNGLMKIYDFNGKAFACLNINLPLPFYWKINFEN